MKTMIAKGAILTAALLRTLGILNRFKTVIRARVRFRLRTRPIANLVIVAAISISVSQTSSTAAQGDAYVASVAAARGFPQVQVNDLPVCGMFWTVQNSARCVMAPLPFPPTDQSVPVYAMDDGSFLVDATGGQLIPSAELDKLIALIHPPEVDTGLDSLTAMVADGALMFGEGASESGVGSESSFGGGIFTNAPETLLFDTMNSSSNGLLASWRDPRPSPVPEGMGLGIVIATNFPFEITRIEAEVLFENAGSLPDTEFEAVFFRSTNKFQYALYLEPEYIASDVNGTLSRTMTDLGNGHWLLSLELPTYAWGTNRVLTIRTVPNSDGAMAKMKLIASSDTVPGVTAFSSDNSNNIVQVATPKMRVWRRMLSEVRSVFHAQVVTDLQLTALPGYQLGSSTNLLDPWSWETDELHNWNALIDTREGMGFFVMRPDPTQ